MLQKTRKIYNAGWRAGMARPRIQYKGGARGILIIITPECPLHGLIATMIWDAGWHAGMVQKLTMKRG